MRTRKRIISLLLTVIMIVSTISVGFASLAVSAAELKEVELQQMERPTATIKASGMTRVSAGQYSSRIGNTIVKATPSGVPESNGIGTSLAYCGETPVATSISFTSEYDVTDLALSCTSGSDDLVLSEPVVDGNTTTWTIVSGTATAGTYLEFTATYKYNGKEYASRCYSYVESIAQGGNRIYTHIKLPSNYWNGVYNDSYSTVSVSTRLLGKGVKYSLTSYDYDYGYDDISNRSSGVLREKGYNTAINMYFYTGSYDTGDKSKTFELNLVKPIADVFIDTSTTSSLSDLNLRLSNVNLGRAGDSSSVNSDQTAHIYTSIRSGYVDALASDVFHDDAAYNVLSPYMSGCTFGQRTSIMTNINTLYFKGSVANLNDGDKFTLVDYFYTSYAASSNIDVVNKTYAPTLVKMNLVDKSALRDTINTVLTSDPTTPVVSNIYKGANPQSWYYKSGYSNFKAALASACSVLNNETATQYEIDSARQSLEAMYSNLVLNSADYTKVNSLLEQADEIIANRNMYTEESISLLQEAYDGVKFSYNLFYQTAVDTMAENLETAINAMDYSDGNYEIVETAKANADTSALKAYFDANKANSYVYDGQTIACYSEEFINTIENAIAAVDNAKEAVVYGLDVSHQAEIDAFATAIDEAYAQLLAIGADYTAANAVKAYAMTLKSANYTNFATVRNAVNKLRTGYTIEKQADLDVLVKGIVDAINGLTLKGATKTALATALALAPEYDENYYVDELYSAWKNLCEEGQTMYDDAELTILDNEKITSKAAEITSAYNALKLKDATKTALATALALTPEYEEGFYTEDTYSAWKALCDEGQVMFDDATLTILDDEAINEKANAITLAFEALDLKGADYSQYEIAVNNFNAKAQLKTLKVVTYANGGTTGEETINNYTESSVNEGSSFIAGCNTELKINDQAIVDGYVEAINNFAENLEESVDYTYLTMAVRELTTLVERDYTPDSWAAYRNAVEATSNLNTQEEINNAVLNIAQARVNLVEEDYVFELKEGSEAIIDKENGFIYGLEEGVISIEDYVHYDHCSIQITDDDSSVGTGTKVEVMVKGVAVETYYIVIFGDLTGDGYVDSFDAAVMASVANFETELEAGSAIEFAADLNKDGFVDSFDMAIITAASNSEITISQK